MIYRKGCDSILDSLSSILTTSKSTVANAKVSYRALHDSITWLMSCPLSCIFIICVIARWETLVPWIMSLHIGIGLWSASANTRLPSSRGATWFTSSRNFLTRAAWLPLPKHCWVLCHWSVYKLLSAAENMICQYLFCLWIAKFYLRKDGILQMPYWE